MCDGLVALNEAVNKLDIDLVSLVAETAVWAHPKIHGELLNLEETGAYFPKTRRLRLRNGEKKHTPVNGEYVDDNTFANRAIKAAIGAVHRDIRNYAACHIWPDSCYRIDCHTVIANLVLLPSPLAALSDHLPAVINALKYRAFDLYGWHPPEAEAPVCPPRYPRNWRAPEMFTDQIQRRIGSRRLNYLELIRK